MKPKTTPSLGGWFAIVGASVLSAIIISAIAAWGNTSDVSLVTKTKVVALDKRVTTVEGQVSEGQSRLGTMEMHQRYLRQQADHTELKVDALLNHFDIPAPAEPPLPREGQ